MSRLAMEPTLWSDPGGEVHSQSCLMAECILHPVWPGGLAREPVATEPILQEAKPAALLSGLNSDSGQPWSPVCDPAQLWSHPAALQQGPVCDPAQLLITACSLAQVGSPASDPPISEHNLQPHLLKEPGQQPWPSVEYRPWPTQLQDAAPPKQQIWPVTSPNSRAQPAAALIVKPSQGPHLNMESSQEHHLVRKHYLRPHPARGNCSA